MSNEPMKTAMKDLQDTLIVMAHIKKRQSEVLKDLVEFQHRSERSLAEIPEFQSRTERNLAEITDKLNGLIGYVDGQRPH